MDLNPVAPPVCALGRLSEMSTGDSLPRDPSSCWSPESALTSSGRGFARTRPKLESCTRGCRGLRRAPRVPLSTGEHAQEGAASVGRSHRTRLGRAYPGLDCGTGRPCPRCADLRIGSDISAEESPLRSEVSQAHTAAQPRAPVLGIEVSLTWWNLWDCI